ncbi:MAG: TrkA C-terminal domain-containing protein [Bacilli bacterium]|nr:TrkA C-terminal domain-containing protein [Bacilli bacterium]
MNITTLLVLFMVIIIIYMALVGLFSTLFRITGLNANKALFQTISLLTSVGFTTTESETITSNPTRRRLAVTCMLIGNLLSIVVISLVVDTVSSFDIDTLNRDSRFLLIAFGVFILFIILINLPFVKKPIESVIQKIGYYFYARKNGGNVITILDSYGDECIAEVLLNNVPEQLQDKTLFESHIKDQYSINVMFIRRKNLNVSINKDTIIQKKDVVVVFGNNKSINTFFGGFKISKEEENELKSSINNEISIIRNYQDKAMVEIAVKIVPDELKDKELADTVIKTKYHINIVLIKRDEGIVNVTRSTKILPGDDLMVFGPYKNIKYLFDMNTKQEVVEIEQ